MTGIRLAIVNTHTYRTLRLYLSRLVGLLSFWCSNSVSNRSFFSNFLRFCCYVVPHTGQPWSFLSSVRTCCDVFFGFPTWLTLTPRVINAVVISPNSTKARTFDSHVIRSSSLKPQQMSVSRRQANDFFAFFFSIFGLGGITKHFKMTGPPGKSEFCFASTSRRSLVEPIEGLEETKLTASLGVSH